MLKIKSLYLPIAFLFLISGNLHSQITDYPCEFEEHELTDISKDADAKQSSTEGDFDPEKALDESLAGTSRSETGNDPNAWYELDLKKFSLESIKIWYPDDKPLEEFYLLLASEKIETKNLSQALSTPGVEHFYIEGISSGQKVPLNLSGVKYIRIQKEEGGVLSIVEIDIPGDGDEEICGNGEDDDCDGLVDCEDNDCMPNIQWVTKKNPTCKSCLDGEIRVKAYGENLEFSIDGGQTYSSCGSSGQSAECTFTGLGEGDYNVKVRNAYCENEWGQNPVMLRGPAGDPSGTFCDNGGFEEGTETNWTATTGKNDDGKYKDREDIASFNSSESHNLRSNTVIAPFIGTTVSPVEGTYFLQLGNGVEEGASAVYCLTVDATNQDNRFWYYFISQAPHGAGDNPFFEWRILNSNGDVLESLGKIVADVDDPFFTVVNSNVFKPWTCQPLNLTQYNGQEICIEFIVTDCDPEAHEGIVYIDGLCSDPIAPSAEITSPPAFCSNQSVDITVGNENLMNQFQWEIERLDATGNVISGTKATLEKTISNEVPDLIDLISVYQGFFPNYSYDCTHKFRLILKLFHDCGEATVTQDISFFCNAADLNYKDLIICSEGQDVQIIGTNTCNDCEITWSIVDDPYNTGLSATTLLDDIHAVNPTILGTINGFALDMTYGVDVVTPEGCVYEEEVRIFNLGAFNVNFGSEVTDVCTFDSITEITYSYPIDMTEYFEIEYFIKGNYGQEDYDAFFDNLPEEEMAWEFVNFNPPSSEFHIRPTSINRLPRIKQEIIIKISIKDDLNSNDVEVIGSGCDEREFRHLREADSPFFGGIAYYLPTVFSPNASEPDNQIIRPYFGDGIPDGEYNDISVYEVWFQVFDRWGGLAHFAHVKVNGEQPFTQDDLAALAWDGAIDGEEAEGGVYTYMIDYQNCSVSPADCFPNSDPPTKENEIIAPSVRISNGGGGSSGSTIPNGPSFPFTRLASGREIRVDHYELDIEECGWPYNPNGNLIKGWRTCIAPGCNTEFRSGEFNLIY